MAGPTLVITEKKPLIWFLAWGMLVAVLLATSYYIGRYLAISEQQETLERAAWLEKQLEEYQQAYQKANQDLVMQTQSAKVDNQSSQQLVETVKQLQETQRELEAELKFYRNIMAPEKDQQGLPIANLELNELESDERLSFKLVLTQAGKQEQFLKGDVEIVLEGQLENQSKSYQFRELGAFQAKDFQFQFRYFQNIEGEIALPKGFVAEQITVKARTRGLRTNQSAEREFSWKI